MKHVILMQFSAYLAHVLCLSHAFLQQNLFEIFFFMFLYAVRNAKNLAVIHLGAVQHYFGALYTLHRQHFFLF